MSLNTKEWSWYKLIDIFGNCERGTRITKESREKGDIAFVTAGELNEGVSEYISNDEAKTYSNCLTIDMFCNCFYHGYQFKCDDNIIVVQNEHLNYYVGTFIACIITNDRYKFSYGRQYRQADYYEHMIKLPRSKNGNPDWDYMENFIKHLKYKKITTRNISDKEQLNTKEWKDFLLNDYFDIMPGIYHYPDEYSFGNTPYVSASNENNGIKEYIDLEPDFKGNCIVTGKVGCTAFYQQDDFCATSDVNIFVPKFKLNQYIGLFIVSVINFSENYKWSYGRQCRSGDSKQIVIKLPCSKNGSPDWDYMTEYIKLLPYGDRI